MVFSVSVKKIILSSLEGKESGGVVFIGPKGVFKLFSSEIIINKFLSDYSSYIPFNHSDIFVAGPYYYRLYYEFFEKNFDSVLKNEKLRDLFIRFLGFCIANRNFSGEKSAIPELLFYINRIRNFESLESNDIKKLFIYINEVTTTLSRIEVIGIDTIREVIKFSSRKSLSGYKFVIMSEFDKSTVEAQNAFLKLLEEPPKGVFFILTASNYDKILPTVKSRVYKVLFFKLRGEELKSYFDGILNFDLDGYYSFYDLMLENVYSISSDFFGKILNVMFSYNLEVAMDFVESIYENDALVEKFFEFSSDIIKCMLEVRAKFTGLNVEVNKGILSKIPKDVFRKFTISKLVKLQSILNDGYSKVYNFNVNPKFVIINFFMEFFNEATRT